MSAKFVRSALSEKHGDTDVQQGMFQGKEGFLGQGHFDKPFMYDTQKKGPA